MDEMTDDELTSRWEAGEVFTGGITHEQHVRIAWVLCRRHGGTVAKRRLTLGTRQACERHGFPQKFDPDLTNRWADALIEAIDKYGPESSAGAFLARHPEFAHGGFLGPAVHN